MRNPLWLIADAVLLFVAAVALACFALALGVLTAVVAQHVADVAALPFNQ